MDELETLNMLLRLIGSSAVNSLDTDHPDAANAKSTMKRVSRRVQRRGWWFNIDYGVEYQPDSNGFIKVPKGISSLVSTNNIVTRGKRLYDKTANSYTFTSPVTATRTIRILDWDDLPEVVQEHAAYYAASEFVRDELEDPAKEQSLQQSAAASAMDMGKQDLEESQHNIFQKARVRRARQGVRPYYRGASRFGSPDA